jgi:hypothetical protein
MSCSRSFGSGAIAVTLGMVLLGCSAEQQAKPPAGAETTSSPNTTEEESDVNEGMAKLSPEDRALAEAQKICPVSDEPLGNMGTPIKVTVDGRDVFVCCAGCVDELKGNFDKYADKLEKQS